MTPSTPSDPADPPDSCSTESVLVRTPTTDPIALLSAASIDPSCGRLLAVLATLPQEYVEQRLSESGSVPKDCRIVEFVRSSDSERRRSTGDGKQVHGDLTGLSMALVGEFDWLAADESGVVYLDSLERYVSAAGLESTFRFLVIVAARARSIGVTLVARVDDETLEPVPVEILAEAFDRIVELPSTDGVGQFEPDGTGDTE